MDHLRDPVVNDVGKVVVEIIRLQGKSGVHHPVRILNELGDVVVVPRRDGDHRNAQAGGKPVAVNDDPLLLHLVHKVQGHHRGPLQFQKLHGQVEVPLQVGGIYDVDNGVGLPLQDVLPRHDLLHGVGGEGVDPRQIHQGKALLPHVGDALLLLHRHPRPVAHILVGPGEGVEERGLSRVGVSHQGHLPLVLVVLGGVVLLRMLALLVEMSLPHGLQGVPLSAGHGAAAALPVAPSPQVVGALRYGAWFLLCRRLVHNMYTDLGRVRAAQGQLIAP